MSFTSKLGATVVAGLATFGLYKIFEKKIDENPVVQDAIKNFKKGLKEGFGGKKEPTQEVPPTNDV